MQNETPHSHFGEWLRRLRVERGFTNATLSKAFGVSELTLARMFETEKASWQDRARCALALAAPVPAEMHDADPKLHRAPAGLAELEEHLRCA